VFSQFLFVKQFVLSSLQIFIICNLNFLALFYPVFPGPSISKKNSSIAFRLCHSKQNGQDCIESRPAVEL